MDACPCCGDAKASSVDLCPRCDAQLGNAAAGAGKSPDVSTVRPSDTAAGPAEDLDSDTPVRCPKCGHKHAAGVFRCYACNSSLRPVFLGIVTVAGPILLVLFSLSVIDEFRRGRPPLLALLLNAAQFAVLLGLRFGRNWAWIAIHFLWLVNLALVAATEIRATGTARVSLIYVFVIATLWVYLHSPGVRVFCSFGRRRK